MSPSRRVDSLVSVRSAITVEASVPARPTAEPKRRRFPERPRVRAEVAGAETHAAALVRPRTRPGRSPVPCPSRQVVVPFTMTILIPRAGRAGSTKSPTSLTLSGSNTTRSAYAPFRSTPRSGKPNHFAGRPHAAHGLFQREQPDITRIMTEHARERAPQGCRGRPMRSAGFSRINRAITTCARTSARFSATTSQSHRGTSERRRLHGWMSLQ